MLVIVFWLGLAIRSWSAGSARRRLTARGCSA